MAYYRKLPVDVEARRILDDTTIVEVIDWIIRNGAYAVPLRSSTPEPGDPYVGITIHTLEGAMRADLGDWIIRGIEHEFYPCKPGIFSRTYRYVGDHAPSVR